MKKLLLLMLVVVATTTSNAQGWMFFSLDEIKKELIESDYVIGYGNSSDGTQYVTLNDDNFEWVLFFDKEVNIVYESKFICKNADAFVYAIGELNKSNGKLVKSGDGHWIYFMGSGVIDIRTALTEYSDYPVIFYTYKNY